MSFFELVFQISYLLIFGLSELPLIHPVLSVTSLQGRDYPSSILRLLLNVLLYVVQKCVLLILELLDSQSELFSLINWRDPHRCVLELFFHGLDLVRKFLIPLLSIGQVLLSDSELALEFDHIGRELLLKKLWRERFLT